MDRRSFIKNVSATSTAVYCSPGLTMGTTSSPADPASVTLKSDISNSICANFGAGFQVVDVFRGKGTTWANISNRDNHYVVSSNDQLNWHIVSSTSM